jgi:NAD+ synthase (glutamine-hydrolysing)
MRIGLAQMRVVTNAVNRNVLRVREYMHIAQMQGVDILVCPEMCLTGYFLGDRWECNHLLRATHEAHNSLFADSSAMALVFGSLRVFENAKNEDGRPRKTNAAFVAQNGSNALHFSHPLDCVAKSLSPNYRAFDDSRHFFDSRKWHSELPDTHAHQALLKPFEFTSSNVASRIGITVCEDLWDENYALKPLLLQAPQSDILINISCSPYSDAKETRRRKLLQQAAKATQRPLFYVNCVGTQNIGKTVYGFDGQSLAVAPDGNIVGEGAFFEEQLLIYDVHGGQINPVSQIQMETPTNRTHLTRSALPQKQKALESTLSFVCEEMNIQHCTIGVSGGIDSALSATLFSRVLGPDNLMLVNMPSHYNSQLTRNWAQQLANNLSAPFCEIPIQSAVELTRQQLMETENLANHPRFELSKWVLENVQARDRSARLLAGVAASLRGVFPCNANKAETTVGYSTLYGDQSGFLCPLADLWKFEVYEFAKSYNTLMGHFVIPEGTLNVVPSAELSAEQNIEQGQGDPLVYPYHDHLFRSWVERWERWTPLDVLESYELGTLESDLSIPKGLVRTLFPTSQSFVSDLEKWWSLYSGLAVAKRLQAPPVVSLSRRAFGFDHRETLSGWILTDSLYESIKQRILAKTSFD